MKRPLMPSTDEDINLAIDAYRHVVESRGENLDLSRELFDASIDALRREWETQAATWRAEGRDPDPILLSEFTIDWAVEWHRLTLVRRGETENMQKQIANYRRFLQAMSPEWGRLKRPRLGVCKSPSFSGEKLQ